MLIQHSGSLAGGYREGIHSFTAPRKERGKKTPPSLALNGMKKRWETLTLWDKKKNLILSPIFFLGIYYRIDSHSDDNAAEMCCRGKKKKKKKLSPEAGILTPDAHGLEGIQ